MNIEPAVLEDAEEILALQRIAYQSEALLYNDYQLEPLCQTLEQVRQQFRDHIFLKVVGLGIIIGSVRACLDEGTCRIGKLIVHPDYQNRGIGKQLMRAIEVAFAGCGRYELFTGSKSVRNIRFYEKLGYTMVKQVAVKPELTLHYMEKLSIIE
ncbi:GNAT family N-acetyltransferase [Paenibacillus xylaniclasticus]|uniref:GNAT family N-acetyltransferase n=1 Tax=Paenibacillus xylaniclasticus TaxID=588083 RepID=UPI000FD7015A|nr:GNAT family N-acetyltransferase [Paenibacillus xylaniclasticus]